jgi:D-apionolactonase
VSPTQYERWYGRDEPPTQLRWLRAGPLEVALDGADLRYVRLGAVELVRRVYVAVRDLNWSTIAAVERDVAVHESADGFRVRCHVAHRRGQIGFRWDGALEGRPDGTITYALDGRCEAEFDFARIGICVHHPSRECAGRPYRATTPAGMLEGVLPLTIGPQVYDASKGYELPLFDPCSALSIELEDGTGVDFEFDGELFEMEDQRNWTDASLKSLAMPSYLGFVHRAEPGRRISQQVTIRYRPGTAPSGAAARHATGREPDVLTLGEPLGRRLPPIGFGLPSDGRPNTAGELQRVRALRPAHLRADVDAHERGVLAQALETCAAVGAGLELALFVASGDDPELHAIVEALAGASVARVLVFQRDRATTGAATVAAVRKRLSLGEVPFAGGTNVYFCDVNRDRPDVIGIDGLAYSINSQVHAFDERSLAEALEAHGDTVRSARATFGAVPIVVSPVTLRPRFNPDAVAEDGASDEPELPSEVDPRQMSMFGAVWTLGSVKSLAEAGAASLTYYETVGWRGLFERDAGNPQPELFPSTPGMLFPVYELFLGLGAWAGAELLGLSASAPLNVVGLALRQEGSTQLTVGNLTAEPRRVEVAPLRRRLELEPFAIERLSVA